MKRAYVNKQCCHGCHLYEYNCANSGEINTFKALKGKLIPLRTINFEMLEKIPVLIAFCEENRRKKLGGVV